MVYAAINIRIVFLLLDGEPKSLETAVAALEPIAKEYVAKWANEEKEQVC